MRPLRSIASTSAPIRKSTYKLTEVEALLRCSRDTINRLERVGLLQVDGATSRQRRANGRSVRRLLARIEEGESLWDLLRAAKAAQSAPAPTVRAPSTTTAPGG